MLPFPAGIKENIMKNQIQLWEINYSRSIYYFKDGQFLGHVNFEIL